ncbi:MAG: beta-1,6-N-acetylglucosaminyltransferase [Pseudomonadota bacterium]
MNVGVVMLVHTALPRAEQVARHWAVQGCPVVIHVDRIVDKKTYDDFVEALSDLPNVSFSARKRCEWGSWGLVSATQAACEQILSLHKEVAHVYLASGACLPLRPISDLKTYLLDRPTTDFIESATIDEVQWTIGGLDRERFTLRFPFSWKRQRSLFDAYVELQRRVGFQRSIPEALEPHMGSQWWCLTRQTLTAILQDPRRKVFDAYFKKVWIPDESYFQTLARVYSRRIESRSLTLSKFDFQGKPHIFYDDHLQLLRRSDCFVARKIWPKADKLYAMFLQNTDGTLNQTEPTPSKIDRIFSKAVDRRTRGRSGLYMQSRMPREGWEGSLTSAPYSVFCGFTDLFVDFEDWLARVTSARIHGHLFAPERAEFFGRGAVFSGGLSAAAKIRDYDPKAFLKSMIWNTRGERQCFQFSPRDEQKVTDLLVRDQNAQISIVTGAWALPLFVSNRDFRDVRREAAELQRIETAFLAKCRHAHTKARVKIWPLADFVETPMEPLQSIIDDMGQRPMRRLTAVPQMVELLGFGQFLQNLKNQGMHPYLMGDFPADSEAIVKQPQGRKPYLVKR